MGFLDNVKSFWHSVTTDDHYASYGSPYKNSSAGGSIDPASSTARLTELNNSSSHSLIGSRNASSTNIGGYRPGLRSSSTNLINQQGGEVQMQSLSRDGQSPLPSIGSLWDRIEKWLEEEYPELEDSLNDGASTADLNELEKDLAIGPLPVEVRQLYKAHDGQFRGGKPTGLVMGLVLMDLESVMEEYTLWSKVAERIENQQMAIEHQKSKLNAEGTLASGASSARENQLNNFLAHQKSVPVHAVQPYYVHRGWVPLIKDLCGNLIALDLAPGPAGLRGQIILFGREFDTKVVIASNLQDFLFQFVTDLEVGNFQIDHSESLADNGFLDSSRTDDYMIGDEDEGNGELAFLDHDGKEFGPELRGKLTYIDVLKRRALKRFGITNVDGFQTSFTPQKVHRRPPQTRSTEGSSQSTRRNASQTKLSNAGSTSSLPKETLIDETKKTEEPSTQAQPSEPSKEKKEPAASKSDDGQIEANATSLSDQKEDKSETKETTDELSAKDDKEAEGEENKKSQEHPDGTTEIEL